MADVTTTPSLTRQLPASGEIESILRARVASGSAVGLAAGIVTTAGQSVTATAGSRRAGEEEPIATTTVFEIGSLTKLFTAILLADLAVRGRVALQDPVAAVLARALRLPARRGDITLVDLATHTSGLPRLPTNLAGADTANLAAYTVEDLYAFLSDYRLSRDVGSQYE